jgi:hypothetical protein
MSDPRTTVPPFAVLALKLSSQDWTEIGQGDDPLTMASNDFETNVERLTAVFLVRMVARVMEVQAAKQNTEQVAPFPKCNYSTTCICREFLMRKADWPVEPNVVQEAELFVRNILAKYKPSVPYHNSAHAAHVTLSTNKLVDMLWNQVDFDESSKSTRSFGLRQNSLALMALIFSSIIHDVEHQGIPNRQLVLEDDELAVLYNDVSVAEQRSLYVGFKEFLKPEYDSLRKAVFPDKEDYREFRAHVVGLVLNTDIASPERTQLAKSNYLEAFGPISSNDTQTKNDDTNNDTFATTDRVELMEDDVEESMLQHVRKTPMNTLKMVKGGEQNVSESVADSMKAVGGGVMNATGSVVGEVEHGVTGSMKVVRISATKMRGSAQSTDVSAMTNESQIEKDNADDVQSSNLGTKVSPKPIKAITSMPMRGMKMFSGTVSGGVRKVSKTFRKPSKGSSTADASSSVGVEESETTNIDQYEYNSVPEVKTDDEKRPTIARVLPKLGKSLRALSGRSTSLPNRLSSRPTRLGIRMSIDLTGETLETFARRRTSLGYDANDVVDDLKMTVLMELIITVADISQNMQGYDQMCKWAGRLYNELRLAWLEDRGIDPKVQWFQNQIGFLDFYLAPLSQRLGATGVYGEMGSIFGKVVESNRDTWLLKGQQSTHAILADGHRLYPGVDSDDFDPVFKDTHGAQVVSQDPVAIALEKATVGNDVNVP